MHTTTPVANLYSVGNQIANKITKQLPNIDGWFLGEHILGEFVQCEYMPREAEELEMHFIKIANLMNATIVESVFHKFNPYGLSGVVVIAESHLAVHTWPEHNCMAVDLFSCGKINPGPGWEYLKSLCRPHFVEMLAFPRGKRIKFFSGLLN